MSRHIVALLTGIIFGLGLAVSGMINPEKVLGFLDIAGAWDPSLALVMGGAVGVTLLTFRRVLKLPKPLFGARFEIPTSARRASARLTSNKPPITSAAPTSNARLGSSLIVTAASTIPKIGTRFMYTAAFIGPSACTPSQYHKKPRPIVSTPCTASSATIRGSDSMLTVASRFQIIAGSMSTAPARQA